MYRRLNVGILTSFLVFLNLVLYLRRSLDKAFEERSLRNTHTDSINDQIYTVLEPTSTSNFQSKRNETKILVYQSQTKASMDLPDKLWIKKQFAKAARMINPSYVLPTWNDWNVIRGHQLHYFEKINLILLGIPKSGCSNWIEVMLRLEGIISKPKSLKYVFVVHFDVSKDIRINRENMVRWDVSWMTKALTVVVLRNPWVRLVSAYRDKLSSEKTQGNSQIWKARNIVSIVRNITLDQAAEQKLFPTFEEFLRFILYYEEGNPDIHWRTQYSYLQIDKIHYDHVVPLEMADTGSRAIFKELGKKNVQMLGSYDKSSDPLTQTSTKRAKEWFSEIDRQIVEDLYRKYEIDFVLLNYSNFSDPTFPLPLMM